VNYIIVNIAKIIARFKLTTTRVCMVIKWK